MANPNRWYQTGYVGLNGEAFNISQDELKKRVDSLLERLEKLEKLVNDLAIEYKKEKEKAPFDVEIVEKDDKHA